MIRSAHYFITSPKISPKDISSTISKVDFDIKEISYNVQFECLRNKQILHTLHQNQLIIVLLEVNGFSNIITHTHIIYNL